MNTIAERIRFAMNVRNVKQVEMVQRTGITKGAFSSYLSGNYNPKKDKLELIADALDININWLMGENVPMENSSAKDNPATGYVFYKEMEYLLNDTDTAYIGFQTQYGALIPRYQIYVNVSLNEMHIVPIFLREDSKEYYQYPKELTQPESYEIFTKDFASIHMTLATSQIYYYGINEKTLEMEIFSFAYSSEKNCYVASDCQPVLCDEFVREMPEGYQTLLGENGSTLSGGERQRISIARALLKNAPIILLDEATASLDPENEVLVQKAIAKLIEGKTVIMIAHRLRTVVDADQIFVLEKNYSQEKHFR